MPKSLNLGYDPAKWKVQSVNTPFKLSRIQNVFSDPQYVMKLGKELEKLKFSHNMNDIFSLHQTKDLAYLKDLTKFPMISKYLHFLDDFKDILAQEMNVQLEPSISVSSSKYNNQDFLLCHDDNLEDRYIAFIFYLNPVWKTEWGGSLDIFDHDDQGQPTRIVYSIPPEFNSLIFFQVGNLTYHQVAEIVSDETPRLTINGWFHSREALPIKPLCHELAMPFLETHDEGALIYLHHFVNNDFLNESNSSLISETFQEKNVIMLQSFLKIEVFTKICEDLRSSHVCWKRKGPANRRRYDIVDEKSLPPLTTAFVNFMKSRYMCSYLESVSDYDLFQNRNGKYNGLVHTEIQSWKSSYYSLLTDSDTQYENDTIEMWLFFNVQGETNAELKANDKEQPGNIYYCKKNSFSAELEIEPADNSICLVRKNKNETMFVSYISAKSSLRYQVLRVCWKIEPN